MYKCAPWILLAGLLSPMSGTADEPPIRQCGKLLPAGSHYSVQMDIQFDRRSEPMTGGMEVSLTDERTGRRPQELSAEMGAFVGCVLGVIGVPDADR